LSKTALDGRIVILTGGAGLLGRNYAAALSEEGAHVVVADVDGERAERVASSLRGAEGMAVAVDISRPSSVQEMVKSVLDRFLRIDGLVNNAALDPKFDRAHANRHDTAFESYPLASWKQSLDVDLTGTFLCTQAVAPVFLDRGAGSIVNVASIYGLVGPDQRLYQDGGDTTRFKPVAYSVTKSALIGLTRYLAAYWADKGIRINTLTLGGVENDHERDFVRRYSRRAPLGRMARPDEYNGALVFLLSDASSYMTGANLVVDGGWTAW
jgi:NAD(P)-dependent dehydrogenase (short-subunit alcohol dehydrogenase family)